MASVLKSVLSLNKFLTLRHAEFCSYMYEAIISVYDSSWATIQTYTVADFIYLWQVHNLVAL